MAIKQDVVNLRLLYGVDAPMFIYDGKDENACACSKGTSVVEESGNLTIRSDGLGRFEVAAATKGTDGTVFFDLSLLQKLFRKKTLYGVPYIIAHEFAHVYQNNRHFPSLEKVKPKELDADFLAGYAMRRRYNFDPLTDVNQVRQAVFNVGDTKFDSPQHHGTSQERLDAFVEGSTHTGTLSEAYEAGLKYVGVDDDATVGSDLDHATGKVGVWR